MACHLLFPDEVRSKLAAIRSRISYCFLFLPICRDATPICAELSASGDCLPAFSAGMRPKPEPVRTSFVLTSLKATITGNCVRRLE